MATKKVSLKDMAEELEISVSTVSRALKDHPDIGKELKVKVFNLAKKYNYPVAQKTQTSKNNKTHTIGVIVPNVEKNFYASIISGVEEYAKQMGYFIIIANSRESYKSEIECVDNLMKLQVDGLIVCLSQETENNEHFLKARKKDIPLVFFDRVCRTGEFSSVIADNKEAAYKITSHLLDNQCTRIAHITGPSKLSVTKERIAGYSEALKDHGHPFLPEQLEYCDLSPDGAQKAVQKLMRQKNRPDAIFCVNDTVAFVVMKEIKQMGFKIPEDIAITGFNNEFHSTIVEPELTTIAHPTFEMGQETARLLLDQLASDFPHSPRQVILKTQMVVRKSSLKE